ncbi:MAG: HEAT repeat domain-containing protein [Bacteroidetes bacterium]|nr:HEAT repeat domain-containing protein [Bacteroidota bacterium]
MRKAIALAAAVAVFALGSGSLSYASEKPDLGSEKKYEMAETNLLIGHQSDNQGLRESAAYMLGELKSAKAVIPLMKILRSEEHESSRIVAALALCRIGDARGVYAVKQATKFDDSQFVQQKCAWFYDQYVQPGSFDFMAAGAERTEDGTSLAAR